jgi:4-hydroxybenzoate polyprenyltransferase
LLLLPCLWAIALAANSEGWRWIDLWLVPACTLGAFLMRGAGCTWNDYTDRHFDGAVARTASRPIPSGQVTPVGALVWMVIQALLAALILFTFKWPAIVLGVLSLALVAAYPFAKRFTWWPQVFLGLAFNWGALLLWAAKTGGLGLAPLALYLAGIAWTLHYDTIYAHQDRDDDALIGIKSTARLFGEATPAMLWRFTGITGLFAASAVLAAGGGIFGLIGLLAMLGHMVWQIRTLDIDDPEECMVLFRSNRNAGLLLLAGLVIDSFL